MFCGPSVLLETAGSRDVRTYLRGKPIQISVGEQNASEAGIPSALAYTHLSVLYSAGNRSQPRTVVHGVSDDLFMPIIDSSRQFRSSSVSNAPQQARLHLQPQPLERIAGVGRVQVDGEDCAPLLQSVGFHSHSCTRCGGAAHYAVHETTHARRDLGLLLRPQPQTLQVLIFLTTKTSLFLPKQLPD